MKSCESICDQGASVWTESVVVEDEVLEGDVGGEEGDKGGLGVQTEGVVI